MRKHCPRQSILAIKNQKRVVIWAKRALKSFVGVPAPSGFEDKSNALNLASSNCSACWKNKKQKQNDVFLVNNVRHTTIRSNAALRATSMKNQENHIFGEAQL